MYFYFTTLCFQQFKDDLSTHRELIQMLSTSSIGQRGTVIQKEAAEVPHITEEALQRKWQNLSKELQDRTKRLHESIQNKSTGVSTLLYSCQTTTNNRANTA